MLMACYFLGSSHSLYSELSRLTKPWEKFRGRGKASRFFTRDKDEAALRRFAEDVGRALQMFQVSNPSRPVPLADTVLCLGRRDCECPSTSTQWCTRTSPNRA